METPVDLATVAVQSVELADETCDVNLSATAIEPTVTTHRPATIRLMARNVADSERKVLAGQGDRRVFSTYESATTDPGLVLATPREVADAQPDPDTQSSQEAERTCWRLTRVPRSYYLSLTYSVLSPGKRKSLDLQVWGHPSNPDDDCLPSGTYHFEERYEVAPSDGDPCRFDWKFDLSVREIDGTAE